MRATWEVVVDGLGNLEAPCFDLEGRLCFSEMVGDGAVYRLGASGRLEVVADGRPHVGGLVPHAGGGLVATGSTVARIGVGVTSVIMDAAEFGGWGFNDLRTDADGNVYVGMHGERPTIDVPERDASLWRIGTDGSITKCYGDVHLTNGIGLSPDGSLLYHCDSLRKLVWVSDVSSSGGVSNRRVFAELPDGFPDGMSVDESGAVWVAAIGAGRIVRFAPTGALDGVLETPAAYVSALCFGGSDNRDLYVTTFGARYEPGNTGGVISTRVEVGGLPVPPAKV